MPATMTHQLFAQTIINLHPRFKNITVDMFKVLMLATQGPDPFFFYGMHPFIKRQDKKRVQGIGSKLHHEDPAKNLKDLLDHAFNDVSKDKDIKVNYALGALMHYVLDRHVHGYVFSISGFDEDGQLSYPYNVYHSYCETLIDVALLKQKKERISKVHPKRNIHVRQHELNAIQDLYQQTYPELVQKDDFIHAAHDMVSIYRTVYDRLGIKHYVLKLLLGKHSQAFAASHPRKLNRKEVEVDVLNLSKKPWEHPEDQTRYHTSVLDMFDTAVNDMMTILDAIDQQQLDLKSYANNKSYDGMTIGKKMMYHSLRFPL
jgi:hypothetical protein